MRIESMLALALSAIPMLLAAQDAPVRDRLVTRVEYGALTRVSGLSLPARHGPTLQVGLRVADGAELLAEASVFLPPPGAPSERTHVIGLVARFEGNRRFAPVRTYGEVGIAFRRLASTPRTDVSRTVSAPSLALGGGFLFGIASDVDVQLGGQLHLGTARIEDRYLNVPPGPMSIAGGSDRTPMTTVRLNAGVTWRP